MQKPPYATLIIILTALAAPDTAAVTVSSLSLATASVTRVTTTESIYTE